MRSETGLAEMDLNEIRRDHPLEVCPQEPFDRPHEVNRGVGLEKALKFCFHSRVFREENEIINVEAEREGGRGWGVVGVGGVDDIAGEETWVVCILLKTELVENLPDFVVPMFRAASQAIECLFQQPIFAFLCVWITDGRYDDGDLVRRQYALAKGVLAIALFEGAPAFDGHAG